VSDVIFVTGWTEWKNKEKTAFLEYAFKEKEMTENNTVHGVKLGSKMTFEDQ
jgi:hypothetical protein